MHEQIPFTFEASGDPEKALDAQYEAAVGVKPTEGMTKEEKEAAIRSPEDERARLRLLAMEEDREDTRRTYRR